MATLYSANNLKVRNSFLSRKTKRIIFYSLMLVLPLVQFAIFYVYVNFKSISMAFMEYPMYDFFGESGAFVGFKNFGIVFDILKARPYLLTNSLILAFFMLCVAMPLAILFSFYVYKKRFLHGFYKVILFLPQIISGVVFASIIYGFFSALSLTSGNTQINPFNQTLMSPAYVRTMLIAFTVWMSFGINVLLFTGAMNNINPSLVEAAELDGCNAFREFIHVTFPSIFPTIVSFVIITVSGIFVNQMFLMEFPKVDEAQHTIGYFLYKNAQNPNNGLFYTDVVDVENDTAFAYPILSAFSLLITAVLLPVTLIIKKLLNKYGPSTK